jgi:hypothetical protein
VDEYAPKIKTPAPRSVTVACGSAVVGAVFYSIVVIALARRYAFLWASLPIPWIVFALALKWRLVGGILLPLVNTAPYAAFALVAGLIPASPSAWPWRASSLCRW